MHLFPNTRAPGRPRAGPSTALVIGCSLLSMILPACAGGTSGPASAAPSARTGSMPASSHVPHVLPTPTLSRPPETTSPTTDPSPLDRTMLVWTPDGLPAGFADGVARIPGVQRSVTVAGGTVWLSRSWSAAGGIAGHPPAGIAFPVSLAGDPPPAIAPLPPPR